MNVSVATVVRLFVLVLTVVVLQIAVVSQINVLDAATLQAAQADPDAYRNLLVRVTGYNAYFVMLGKEIQDEIIARSAHQCR